MPETTIKQLIKARQHTPKEGYEARLDALLQDLIRAPVKTGRKRYSLALVLAIVLILMGLSAAIAANMGVFGQFAQRAHDDRKLYQLSLTSTAYNKHILIPGDAAKGFPDTVFTLDQAHYDGESLYISYQLSAKEGRLARVQMHRQAPTEQDLQASRQLHEEDVKLLLHDLLGQVAWDEIDKQRADQGWVRFSLTTQYLADSAQLEDGAALYPVQGNLEHDERGSHIAFAEFERPLPQAARNQESLDITLQLYRETRTYYLTQTTAYLLPGGSRDAIPLHIHIQKDNSATIYTTKGHFDLYQIEAQAKVGTVDIKVDLFVSPTKGNITDILDTGATDSEAPTGRITGFALYANGVRSRMIEGSFQLEDSGMRVQLGFQCPDIPQTLVLIPEYDHGNEQPSEALSLIP